MPRASKGPVSSLPEMRGLRGGFGIALWGSAGLRLYRVFKWLQAFLLSWVPHMARVGSSAKRDDRYCGVFSLFCAGCMAGGWVPIQGPLTQFF